MTITICILIFACVLLTGCVPGTYTEQYADPDLWYDSGRGIDPDRADVFYLLPSSVYDWTGPTSAAITFPRRNWRNVQAYVRLRGPMTRACALYTILYRT